MIATPPTNIVIRLLAMIVIMLLPILTHADNPVHQRALVYPTVTFQYIRQEVAELEERANEGDPDAQFRTDRIVGLE